MKIKQINNLILDIQKTPYKYWLNIIKKFKDSDSGYVICGFEYNAEEETYDLNSVGDRIIDKDIEWFDLETLIKYGYKILNNANESLGEMYHRLESEVQNGD